jgi:hypothetical protein
MMNHANAELFELVAAGAITADERGRMTIAACPRREQDLLAPFASDGRFHGLAVEHSNTLSVPDAAWIDFQRDGDAAAFASKRAGFFRAVFVPSLSQALAPTRDAGEGRYSPTAWRRGCGDGLPPVRQAWRTWSGSSLCTSKRPTDRAQTFVFLRSIARSAVGVGNVRLTPKPVKLIEF